MKKAIAVVALCSLLLTACGQIDDAESKPVTAVTAADAVKTSSAKEEKDTSEAATTTINSSQTVSVTSKPTGTTAATTKKIVNSAVATDTTTVKSTTGERVNIRQTEQPQNSASPQSVATKSAVTSTPVTIASKSQTKLQTTIKPQTTTSKPQTTFQTKPSAAEPAEQVVDMNAVSDQVWVFLEYYPIDYNGMYKAGKQLSHDGSEISKAKAVCDYAYTQGGRNCIEYALNAYFLAKGAGLECYLARSSEYDWYGHVANVIRLDGKWYYMEPQANIVGSPVTYATDADYPHGLDIVTDIYDNRISIKISETWYK